MENKDILLDVEKSVLNMFCFACLSLQYMDVSYKVIMRIPL